MKKHTKALFKKANTQSIYQLLALILCTMVNPGNSFLKGKPTYQEAVTGME